MKTIFKSLCSAACAAALTAAFSASLAAVMAAPAAAADASAGPKEERVNILVFGDSNTFGWVASPKDAKGRVTVSRLPVEQTWPQQMASRLGEGYRVTVDALGGRTTDLDEPGGSGSGKIPGVMFNGLTALPSALSSNMPLDLVIVMLGSNDLKVAHDRSAYDIALALGRITSTIVKGRWQSKTDYAAPRVLIVAPPGLDYGKRFYSDFFAGARQKTSDWGRLIEPVVRAGGAEFMNAVDVVGVADQVDGVHMSADEHKALGEAVAQKVKAMMQTK